MQRILIDAGGRKRGKGRVGRRVYGPSVSDGRWMKSGNTYSWPSCGVERGGTLWELPSKDPKHTHTRRQRRDGEITFYPSTSNWSKTVDQMRIWRGQQSKVQNDSRRDGKLLGTWSLDAGRGDIQKNGPLKKRHKKNPPETTTHIKMKSRFAQFFWA